jgi:hypothetical protein
MTPVDKMTPLTGIVEYERLTSNKAGLRRGDMAGDEKKNEGRNQIQTSTNDDGVLMLFEQFAGNMVFVGGYMSHFLLGVYSIFNLLETDLGVLRMPAR